MEQAHPPPLTCKKKIQSRGQVKTKMHPIQFLDLGSGVVVPFIYIVHDRSLGSDKEFKF